MHREQTINWINSLIVKIDELIVNQLNVILHHKKFQQLEASWRGLFYLTEEVAQFSQEKRIKIKVLCLTWQELSKDLSRAIEFDQSQFFSKIYSHEFGHPGGEPFGLLIGDYYVTHKNRKYQTANDISTLDGIAKVAAAAFAPFVTSVEPSFFGMDSFEELDRPFDLERIFQQSEYYQWRKLREAEDARFIGLMLPQVMLRSPYRGEASVNYRVKYREISHKNINHYLWTNAVYCFAAIVTRAYSQYGWFTEIRGKSRSETLAGIVTNLPPDKFSTDRLAQKILTNYCITDSLEKHFSDHGFIALTTSQYSGVAVFYSCPSIQRYNEYNKASATKNAKLSSMLHYMLCVSRFAHYLKVIARDKIGTFVTASATERYLQDWLHLYTAMSDDLSHELKAKYPLREAKVEVFEPIGRADHLLCTIHLCPHYQFDQLETYLQLRTELVRTL